MHLETAFDVTAPIDQVWAALADVEQLTACVPGAELLAVLSEDAGLVVLRVKLGRMSIQYRGQLDVVERKPEIREATLHATAKEARGPGVVEATAHLALSENGPVTRGTISAEVSASGRVTDAGEDLIAKAIKKVTAQFAGNLQALLSPPEPAAARTPEPDPAPAPEPVVEPEPAPAPEPVVEPEPAPAPEPVLEAEPVPASQPVIEAEPGLEPEPVIEPVLEISADPAPLPPATPPPAPASPRYASARALLQDPKRALALTLLLALVAYLLGRRAGRSRN